MKLHRHSQRAVALVIVLGFLVIITVMIIAFFSSATTESVSSHSQADALNARQLADSTTQFVIGQIRQATSGGTTNTWASQPGMIRTYDAQGDAAKAYKLYSAAAMIDEITGDHYDPSIDMPTSPTWAADRAIWTDLNGPVTTRGGTAAFPIIDPRAEATPSGKTSPMVEGFSYDAAAIAGAIAPSSTDDNAARAPMPVRWLYMLRDGRFTSPSGGSADRADFTDSDPKPTKDNPIIGRVAFWTDDETCKLNLNTACGGNYWDIPTYTAGIDFHFSRYKPVKNEFARYPGHPATTSLLPVLWSFANLDSPDYSLFPSLNPPLVSGYYVYIGTGNDAAGTANADVTPTLSTPASGFFKKALSLNPRNMWGGSEMGSVATIVNKTQTINVQSIDSDRLYASVDEAFFGMPAPDETPRPINSFDLKDTDVEKLGFFLTTQSRSPDTNPFNQPKVGIWPIPEPGKKNPANPDAAADGQTPTDKLLAFCSTLNGKPYYFTRNNPDSPSDDFQPGSRNDKIFDYLDRGLQNPIPGFGGSLGTRYGATGTREILTEIYDYIRGSLNITDTFDATTSKFPYAFVPSRATTTYELGRGQVVPIRITKGGKDYKGHGRFVTIKEAGLQFIAVAANQPPLQVVPSGPNAGRPLLFAADGVTSLLDGSYNLTAAGITAVLSGNAYALANPMHPMTSGVPGPVQQLMSGGEPVLAVNSTKLAANPNDTSAIYPVFNPAGEYPTIGNASSPPTNADSKTINLMAGGAEKNLTYSGNPYKYREAARNVSPSALQIQAQTHAGLPYLSVQREKGTSTLGDMEGAYDVPNPRYQGMPNTSSTNQPNATQGSGSLTPGKTQIQAAFLIDPVVVTPGTPPYNGKYQVIVRGLDQFKGDGQSLGFPGAVAQIPSPYSKQTVDYNVGYYTISTLFRSSNSTDGLKLTFVSQRVVAGSGTNGATFAFTGGTVTIEIRTVPSGDPTNPSNMGLLVQTLQMEFPNSTFPVPLLPPMPIQDASPADSSNYGALLNYPFSLSSSYRSTGVPFALQDLVPSSILTFDRSSPLSTGTNAGPNFGVGASIYQEGKTRTAYGAGPSADTFVQNFILPERMTNPATDYHAKLPADTVRCMELLYGDARVASAQATVGTEFFRKHAYYDDITMRGAHSLRYGGTATNFCGTTDQPLSDTKLLYTPDATGTNSYTNNRGLPASADAKVKALGAQQGYNLSSAGGYIVSSFPNVTSSVDFNDPTFAEIWRNGGDYDTGQGLTLDGPYIGKGNEGGGMRSTSLGDYDQYSVNPDFSSFFQFSFEDLNNSPSRQVPSPVIFGSLVVGDSPQTSWRTLLFSPNPNSQSHAALSEVASAGMPPTSGKAPDYLLLDFFNMPIVEPYAISDSFSTAGRVNMNYQLAPFTYIRRDTALRGVLRSGMLVAAEDSKAQNRKMNGTYTSQGQYSDGPAGPYTQFLQDTGHWAFRYPIHVGETLKQFEQRFSGGDIFRSPSEICSLWLYPGKQPTATNPENPGIALVNWDKDSEAIKSWWYDDAGGARKSMTSDNMRERPYATLYPRLTTKSNTYTTYFQVQVLQKSRASKAEEWVEGRDQVRSEYRGSAMIERYIDVSDPNIPDFTDATNAEVSLDNFYRYRVLNIKRFAP